MNRLSSARPCVLCSEIICGTFELGDDVRLFACEPCLLNAALRELSRQAARDANKRDLGGERTVPMVGATIPPPAATLKTTKIRNISMDEIASAYFAGLEES